MKAQTEPRLTKNVISRDAAVKLAPLYVAFIEDRSNNFEAVTKPFWWDHDNTDAHGYPTHGLKKGQRAVTYVDGQYVMVKISSIQNPMHDADGPVVRVSNGEFSWRVDGDKYAFLIEGRRRAPGIQRRAVCGGVPGVQAGK